MMPKTLLAGPCGCDPEHAVAERDTMYLGVNKVPAKVARMRCACGRIYATAAQTVLNQRNVRRALRTARPGTPTERDRQRGG